MLRFLLCVLLVVVGTFLTDGFTNDIGGLVLFMAGALAGKSDGIKQGIREALAGQSENPIK